jgi:hypothetical protein
MEGLGVPLLSITAVLPDSGYYVFGMMDFTQSNMIPVSTNYWIDYLTDYNTLSMRPDNGNLFVKLRAERNSRIALMRAPTVFWAPDGYDIAHSLFVSGDLESNRVGFDLIYRFPRPNMTWRYLMLI